MARSIDYRSTAAYPADQVYAVMVDPAQLRARLTKLGGSKAQLVEHRAGPDSAEYRLQHSLDRAVLPAIVGQLVSGDLVIERTERLRREDTGRYTGEVDVRVPGTPATASGTIRLTDINEGSSELHIQVTVSVRVPLIGGRIEEFVAGQVGDVLAAETAFTVDWLDQG